MGKQLDVQLGVAYADISFSFGAVLEEFEVQDALEGVFAEKAMSSIDNKFHARHVATMA